MEHVIGQIIYGSGKIESFQEPEAFLETVTQEWPYRAWTGFRFETTSLIPEAHKAIQDAAYRELGIKNPHDLNHYKTLYNLTKQSTAPEIGAGERIMDKYSETENLILRECYRQAVAGKISFQAQVTAMLALYEAQTSELLKRDAGKFSPATPLHSWQWQSDEIDAVRSVAEQTQDTFYAYKMAEEFTSCGGRAGYLAMGEAGQLLDTLDQPLAPEQNRRIYDASLAFCESGHFPDGDIKGHLTPLIEKLKQDSFRARMSNAQREATQRQEERPEQQHRHEERGRG